MEKCHIREAREYLGLFQEVTAPAETDAHVTAMTGEFSGTYFGCQCCAATLRSVLPLARMIVMLREPMNRAESRFRESVRRDTPVVRDSTWAAYRDLQLPKLQECLDNAGQNISLRTRCASQDNVFGWSLYDLFLQGWVASGYSSDDFLVLYLDDWTRDPLVQLRSIEHFLRLQSHTYDDSISDIFTYDKEHHIAREANGPGPRNLAFQDKGQQDLLQFYKDSVQNLHRICEEKGWSTPPISWLMKGSAPRKIARMLRS